jgi:integrase
MKKRSNHEGSIGKLKGRNLYYAAIQVNGVRKFVYSKTREEVANKLDDLRLAKRQGVGLVQRDLKLGELVSLWIDSKSAGWSSKTYEHYFGPFKLHILPLISNKKISVINNPVYLDDFFNKTLVKAGLSANNIKRCHKALNNCLEWAVGRNLIAFNKCKGGAKGYFQLPIHTPKAKPQLTIGEVAILAKEIESYDKHGIIFAIALATGMRINEVLGLSVDDIDFESNVLTVRHQLKREQGVVYLDRTKSKIIRNIPLDQRLMDKLFFHLARVDSFLNADKSVKYNPYASCNCCSSKKFQLAFISEVGTALDYDNLRARHWNKVMNNTSLNVRLTLHDLRHIFASVNLTNGVDVVTVSKLMGHANPSITLKVYAQYITPPNVEEVASFMAELFA